MQHRMKKHPLSLEEIKKLLDSEPVGHFATLDPTGCPYVCPMSFAYANQQIYMHSLKHGRKIDNLLARPQVGFVVSKMQGLVSNAEPCSTNVLYESVVIRGEAFLVSDAEEIKLGLDAIVNKYTPQNLGKSYPEKALEMTAVFKIVIAECTGKYYRGKAGN